MNLVTIFLTSVIAENVILTKFLGICPFIGTSNKEKGALGMGISVSLIVVVSSIITYLIYNYILFPDYTYLRTILFVLVIASTVQIVDIILRKTNPKLHTMLGIYLPLTAANCAVLGIPLLIVTREYNFLEMLTFSVGSSFGFAMLIYIYATVRERMENSPIPQSFKGVPIALITAGIMAILFSRYM